MSFSDPKHLHTPRNVNLLHQEEHDHASLNQRIAVFITQIMSSMATFWLILAWIVFWIVANVTITRFDPLPFPLLLALASIPQLPLMAVIMIGQSVLARHQELQSDEQYKFVVKSYEDTERIIGMLDHLLLIEQQRSEAEQQLALSLPRRRRKTTDANE